MKVNDACTGCEACLPYCTQGAIFMNEEARAAVNRELCVECGVCIDSDICPVSAFEEDHDELAEFKRPFGRLLAKHVTPKDVVSADGYDVKTDDVTGEIPKTKVVMRFEINRPRGGFKFGDVEKMRSELERLGWRPDVTSRSRSLRESGFADKAADQRILSCYLELVIDPQEIPDVVNGVTAFLADQELWVSINVAGVAETIGRTEKILQHSGIGMEAVAKVNLGLGRKP